jgi:hypothetical protein
MITNGYKVDFVKLFSQVTDERLEVMLALDYHDIFKGHIRREIQRRAETK